MILDFKKIRLEKFLTQSELAKAAGLSFTRLNQLENGKSARITTVRKIALALGVEPGTLIKKED